jgi:hypothetical protein
MDRHLGQRDPVQRGYLEPLLNRLAMVIAGFACCCLSTWRCSRVSAFSASAQSGLARSPAECAVNRSAGRCPPVDHNCVDPDLQTDAVATSGWPVKGQRPALASEGPAISHSEFAPRA